MLPFWVIIERMSPLLPEAAGTLFREYFAWFGPPALLRRAPSQFGLTVDSQCDDEAYIIDGRIRYRALIAQGLRRVWLDPDFPHFVFLPETVYSTEGRKSLPRLLTLAGHYDRAARFVPEPWNFSAPDVAAFLNVSMLEAVEVYAAVRGEQRKRPRFVQLRKRDNEKIVDRIRAGLAARSEGESEFGLLDVARLVDFEGPL
jgi:hypothetical protein